MTTNKRRLAWSWEIIQDAKKYGAPDGNFIESKKPRPYSSYMALVSDINNAKPTCYEEVTCYSPKILYLCINGISLSTCTIFQIIVEDLSLKKHSLEHVRTLLHYFLHTYAR
jgi:hypothetical protein